MKVDLHDGWIALGVKPHAWIKHTVSTRTRISFMLRGRGRMCDVTQRKSPRSKMNTAPPRGVSSIRFDTTVVSVSCFRFLFYCRRHETPLSLPKMKELVELMCGCFLRHPLLSCSACCDHRGNSRGRMDIEQPPSSCFQHATIKTHRSKGGEGKRARRRAKPLPSPAVLPCPYRCSLC
jgi:hypothetical protein